MKKKKYLFSAYINLSNKSNYSLNQINICFSKKQPKVKEVLILESGSEPREILKCKCSMKISSDTVWNNKEEWVQIEGEYIAKGGEQYITIGLFEKSIKNEEWEKMAILINHISDRAYYYIV